MRNYSVIAILRKQGLLLTMAHCKDKRGFTVATFTVDVNCFTFYAKIIKVHINKKTVSFIEQITLYI